jgi:ElaB/YqjD/DUF883 family membrane-anchored ribosome-binding protein
VSAESPNGAERDELETGEAAARSEAGRESIMDAARARLQASTSRAVDVSSDYLRTHDLDEMRGDLEREIRTHPLRSIALALGAGYVLGKLLR